MREPHRASWFGVRGQGEGVEPGRRFAALIVDCMRLWQRVVLVEEHECIRS